MPKGLYKVEELSHRATIPMTCEMRDALRDLAARCKKGGGRYPNKTQLVRSLIHALIQLQDQVDWSRIKNERELQERLVRAFTRRR